MLNADHGCGRHMMMITSDLHAESAGLADLGTSDCLSAGKERAPPAQDGNYSCFQLLSNSW